MRYQISGKHIDIGSALQQHVKAEIDGVASKYAERPTDAVVVFSKSGHEFVCEATIHLSTGLTAQAKAHNNEIYASFDIVEGNVITATGEEYNLMDHDLMSDDLWWELEMEIKDMIQDFIGSVVSSFGIYLDQIYLE